MAFGPSTNSDFADTMRMLNKQRDLQGVVGLIGHGFGTWLNIK